MGLMNQWTNGPKIILKSKIVKSSVLIFQVSGEATCACAACDGGRGEDHAQDRLRGQGCQGR
jgi:hypothetical protein